MIRSFPTLKGCREPMTDCTALLRCDSSSETHLISWALKVINIRTSERSPGREIKCPELAHTHAHICMYLLIWRSAQPCESRRIEFKFQIPKHHWSLFIFYRNPYTYSTHTLAIFFYLCAYNLNNFYYRQYILFTMEPAFAIYSRFGAAMGSPMSFGDIPDRAGALRKVVQNALLWV